MIKELTSIIRYKKALFRLRNQSNVVSDKEMFFVISAGRSGSTLLRKHLQMHPLVNIPPESEGFIPVMADKWVNSKGDIQSYIRQMVDFVGKQSYLNYWGMDWLQMEKQWNELAKANRPFGDYIHQMYQSHSDVHKKDAKIFGDKTPYLNYYMAYIKQIFPNAKIIYMVRDGRAVANSYIKSRNYNLDQAIHRWKSSINSFQKSPYYESENLKLVKYEDFVSMPESTLKEICEFLKITFEEILLMPDVVEMGDTHLSHHANVQNPINEASIHRWRDELEENALELINKRMRKELRFFNYA